MAKKKDQKTKAQLQEEYNNLIKKRDELIEIQGELMSSLTKEEYKETYGAILKTKDTLNDGISLIKQTRTQESEKIRGQVKHYQDQITNEYEPEIIKLTAEEPKLKLHLAGRLVNNIYILLTHDKKKPSLQMQEFVKKVKEIKDQNKQEVIFKDDGELKQFKSTMPKFTPDKTKESLAILQLSDALNDLTKVDVNIYGSDINAVKKSLEIYTQLAEEAHFKTIYKGGIPKFDEINTIENNRTEVLKQEQKIAFRKQQIEDVQKHSQEADAPMKSQLGELTEEAKKNAGKINVHKDFEESIMDKVNELNEKLEALNQEIDEHPANSKNKRTKLQTVKAAVQKVGDKVQRLTNKAKEKAHALGVTVKSTVSQAQDTIANTKVGRGVSSLKDAIVKDNNGNPSNWKETIKNKLSRTRGGLEK